LLPGLLGNRIRITHLHSLHLRPLLFLNDLLQDCLVLAPRVNPVGLEKNDNDNKDIMQRELQLITYARQSMLYAMPCPPLFNTALHT